jgi:hypothetical protein
MTFPMSVVWQGRKNKEWMNEMWKMFALQWDFSAKVGKEKSLNQQLDEGYTKFVMIMEFDKYILPHL